MLYGTYFHNIDAKGRLFMPAKLREGLGESFFVTQGLDNCLFVYSEPEWEKFAEKLDSIQLADEEGQDFVREFFENGCMCEPDKQGRILLPQTLRDYIGVEKEAVITGIRNRAEIWSKEGWAQRRDKSAEERKKMKSRLFELGI